MFLSKLSLPASLLLSSFFTLTAFSKDLSSDIVVPVSGNHMAAVALPNGNTRIFYQDSTNNSMVQIVIHGPFTVSSFVGANVLVPASEIMPDSPIAAAFVESASGELFEETHIFFFSPENILSEYVYTLGHGFQGGPECTTCVTNKGFQRVPGNQMLYALASSATSPPTVRAGFVSSGTPNTISEAVNTGDGWSVASLSN